MTLQDLIAAARRAAYHGDNAATAIRFVRHQVEGEGLPYELVLQATHAAFTLGLSEFLEIERKAIERYGIDGTWTKGIAAKFAPEKVA